MATHVKYKDLIRKFKKYAEEEVRIVAYNDGVTFYNEEGAIRIVRLLDCEDKEGNYYTIEDKRKGL